MAPPLGYYSSALTLLCPSVTPSLKFADRSITAIQLSRLFGTNSRQHCDNYLTYPTNSPKPHSLLSLHSSFTPNLKYCSSVNPALICYLLPTPSPSQLQTPS